MMSAQIIQLVTTCGISAKMLIWRGGIKKPPAKKSENLEPIVRPIADSASIRSTCLSDLASLFAAAQIALNFGSMIPYLRPFGSYQHFLASGFSGRSASSKPIHAVNLRKRFALLRFLGI